MRTIVERLRNVMSYTEVKAAQYLIAELGCDKEKVVVNSKVSDSNKVTRSVMVNMIRLLEVAGAVESKSLGAKGTNIKVLDENILQEVAKF